MKHSPDTANASGVMSNPPRARHCVRNVRLLATGIITPTITAQNCGRYGGGNVLTPTASIHDPMATST